MKIKVFDGKELDISDELVKQYNCAYKGQRAFGTKDAEYLLMTESVKKDSSLGKKEMEEKLEYAMKDEIQMMKELSDIENVKEIMKIAGAYAGRVKSGKEV